MIETDRSVIAKQVRVRLPPARAFAAFTEDIGAWWPTETHSHDRGAVEADWRPGGLIVETAASGRHEWADVLEFEPPHRLALRWRVSDGSPVTEVRVSFAADGDGTLVELVHLGWETQEQFASYDRGWGTVLAHFASHLT